MHIKDNKNHKEHHGKKESHVNSKDLEAEYKMSDLAER